MLLDDPDKSKTDEILKFIKELDTVNLDTYRVVGNYVRHDPSDRDYLIKIKDKIVYGLQTGKAGQETYLIGGLPGSGKTSFIEELGTFIRDFATFEILKLSDLDEKTFYTKLARLQKVQGPLLCLIDEVDSKQSEPWFSNALLTPLGKPYRSYTTCFVLVGSGGSNVSELKSHIRSSHKGSDILRRITFNGEYTVPRLSLADRILVMLCHLREEARKSNSEVHRVEKLALLYVALNDHLASPSKIHDLAVACIRKKAKSRDTVYFEDFFPPGDKEHRQFVKRWDNEDLCRTIYVKDNQAHVDEGEKERIEEELETVRKEWQKHY